MLVNLGPVAIPTAGEAAEEVPHVTAVAKEITVCLAVLTNVFELKVLRSLS